MRSVELRKRGGGVYQGKHLRKPGLPMFHTQLLYRSHPLHYLPHEQSCDGCHVDRCCVTELV